MGSACCVASRERSTPIRNGGENVRRNVVYSQSPSWSFRWDNRGRVAGEVDTPSYQVSQEISRNASMELKGPLSSERGNFSDMGSPLENFGSPISQKSTLHGRTTAHLMTSPSDISVASNYSPKFQAKNLAEPSGIMESSAPRLSFSMPSAFSTPVFPHSTPSRRARRSPGHQLLRQASDSRIMGLNTPNNNSISGGSHGGSSDGWSMRTFSELVASSQRERWSFDSEHFSTINGKIGESSSRFSSSPSIDTQFCGACCKTLIERSSWSAPELSVVSVLVCGHVYHADCLETMTHDTDKYDPVCPVCVIGEKQMSKNAKKAWRTESELKKSRKISKNRVVDSFVDADFDVFDPQKSMDRKGKCSRLEPSSSSKSSFAKPFLKRHFTLGSKWNRSLSENDSSRKKGFWSRYRKD